VKPVRLAIVLLLLAGFAYTLPAQDIYAHQKTVKLRHLTGFVVDPKGFPVAYAAIELRSAKDHQVIATTFADAKGKFFFRDLKRGTRLDIRASLKGYNIVQYPVAVGRIGKTELRMVLVPIT